MMPHNSTPRVKHAKDGDFVRIPISETQWGYGRVALKTIAVYDVVTSHELSIEEIQNHPILFRVWVMRYAFNGKEWPFVGHLPLEPELQQVAEFLSMRTNADKGKFFGTTDASVHYRITYERAKELELLAVYEPSEVQERLALHAEGKLDPMVEMFRVH